MKKFIKRYYKLFILIILLFIPLYIAVINYYSLNVNPVNLNSVNQIQLKSAGKKPLEYDSSTEEGANILNIFNNIHSTSRTSESLPSDLDTSDFISVIYKNHDVESEYKYYFSPTKPSNSYYVDPNGKVFRISAQSAINFLDSDFSQWLYKGAEVPILSVSDNSVLPIEAEWKYKSYSNLFHNVDTRSKAGQILECSYKNISILFNKTPEKDTINITDSKTEEVLFNGTIQDYNNENPFKKYVRKDSSYNVKIESIWEDSPNSVSSGYLVYDFQINVIFDPDATFWLNENNIECGDFVILSGKYFEEIEGISIYVYPDINYHPVLFTDGDYVRTVIPFPLSLGLTSQDYVITVDYHGVQTKLDLQVNPISAHLASKRYNYGNKVNISARNDSSISELSDFIYNAECGNVIYFNGSFTLPEEKNSRANFGDTVSNNGEIDRFLSNGMAWVCYSDDKIYPTNYGKVIAIGETEYGGTTVIIDHGLGIKSVYYSIKNVQVEVGDNVSPSTVIAYGGGQKGYTDGITSYFELYVGRVPISYYSIVSTGRNKQIVYNDIE